MKKTQILIKIKKVEESWEKLRKVKKYQKTNKNRKDVKKCQIMSKNTKKLWKCVWKRIIIIKINKNTKKFRKRSKNTQAPYLQNDSASECEHVSFCLTCEHETKKCRFCHRVWQHATGLMLHLSTLCSIYRGRYLHILGPRWRIIPVFRLRDRISGLDGAWICSLYIIIYNDVVGWTSSATRGNNGTRRLCREGLLICKDEWKWCSKKDKTIVQFQKTTATRPRQVWQGVCESMIDFFFLYIFLFI